MERLRRCGTKIAESGRFVCIKAQYRKRSAEEDGASGSNGNQDSVIAVVMNPE